MSFTGSQLLVKITKKSNLLFQSGGDTLIIASLITPLIRHTFKTGHNTVTFVVRRVTVQRIVGITAETLTLMDTDLGRITLDA